MSIPEPPDTLDDPKHYLDEAKTVWLGNAEARHRLYPKTFAIPPRSERDGLGRGNIAQVLFKSAPRADGLDGERLWCVVTGRTADGRYEGRINNIPNWLPLRCDQFVVFGPENILKVHAEVLPESRIPKGN